jgi:16S rRNA (cytosine1402-N4)-methyltransferase
MKQMLTKLAKNDLNSHQPVFLKEVLEGMNIKPDGVYLDLTLGRGGHAKAILERITTGCLIGFDQDEEAIKSCEGLKNQSKGRLHIIKSDFSEAVSRIQALNITNIDGALMDLGVSSPQFDNPIRGFSYREEGPLDMRMDQSQKLTAYDVVNKYDLGSLTKVFRDYGDEKYSFSIAKAILKQRDISPILTTTQLVEIIKKSKPSRELKKIGHPAKQVFQAIRIEVNDELGRLKRTLSSIVTILKPGGRLAVITFHSGEDRIVKEAFRSLTVIEGSRRGITSLLPNESPKYSLINKKVIVPTQEEVNDNHRSESAKLRILEKNTTEENV